MNQSVWIGWNQNPAPNPEKAIKLHFDAVKDREGSRVGFIDRTDDGFASRIKFPIISSAKMEVTSLMAVKNYKGRLLAEGYSKVKLI